MDYHPRNDDRVSVHLSAHVLAAMDTGEPDCLMVSRVTQDGTVQTIHAHNNEVETCPLDLLRDGRSTT